MNDSYPEGNYRNRSSIGFNGYLYCNNCNGYYRLQEDETPEDFVSCECGEMLEFYENLPDSSTRTGMEDFDDTEEIEQLLTLLKSKSKKRKELIENLSNHINIQEGLLNEIKEERWNLWDVLNERNLQSDIKNQKRLLDDISENEDRLMSIIKEQRIRAHSSDKLTMSSVIKSIGTRGFIIMEFLIIVVLLLILIF
jgi:hypothetical protein